MIEKLELYEETPSGYKHPENIIQEKINELVDAVNELQKHEEQHLDLLTELNEMRLHKNKEPADPYAEQRKWIGKLCKFWDDSDKPENCVYDILCNIFDQTHHEDCPFQCGNGEWYEYCEPVKPDDDIIYKGGDNE